jgi:hypothetical protein
LRSSRPEPLHEFAVVTPVGADGRRELVEEGPQLNKAAGSADPGAFRSSTMTVMMTAMTPSENASSRAFEKRSSLSAMRAV